MTEPAATVAPIGAIVADAADAFGVSVEAVLDRDRLVRARFAAVWVARELSTFSFAHIGRQMGGRDHSTVQHAYRRAERLRASDPAFRVSTDLLLADARKRTDA